MGESFEVQELKCGGFFAVFALHVARVFMVKQHDDIIYTQYKIATNVPSPAPRFEVLKA